MTGNQVHVVRHMGFQLGDNRTLDRSHIRNDATFCQMRGDAFTKRGKAANRCAEDYAVGPLDGLTDLVGIDVTEIQLFGPVQRFLAAGGNNDGFGQAFPARTQGDGRADQANADQAQPFEQRLCGHIRLSDIHPTRQRRHDRPLQYQWSF